MKAANHFAPALPGFKHSMLRRCLNWDYKEPCIYQITLVLAARASQSLGRLVVDDPGAGAADIRYRGMEPRDVERAARAAVNATPIATDLRNKTP